jgi:hypothetical protein
LDNSQFSLCFVDVLLTRISNASFSTIQEHQLWENSFCSALQSTDEFASAFKCKIKLENCVPESPNDAVAAKEGAPDNYIVSDWRGVVKDQDEGLIYTLETMEQQVADKSLLLSE